jgi:ectoine hydroxylase-related dioxygenase (phytanoyl-CoA dioxygenase family)
MDTTTPATDLRAAYDREGYLVVRDALAGDELAALRAEAAAICRGRRGTLAGTAPAADHETDDDVLVRYLCIHHPHKVSALMHSTLSHPAIVRVLTSVIGPNVKAMQSMLFIKASGKPGQAWHQDEHHIATRDRSLLGAWIALDDATVENGCLWIIPGSHRPGILWPAVETDDERFDCTDESFGFPYTAADEVPVEVTAGSIVFFHGYVLHRSLPNRAPSGYRRSLVNHYMSAESLLPWGRRDVDHAREDYRDIVIVAGKDPYAFKGVHDRVTAHVRPDRAGGCRWA